MAVHKKTTPTWIDVKAKLTDFDRAELFTLIQDLYAASKDTQVFLHSRFALGSDVLKPYKAKIRRWLWPNENQDTSVATAKKAIADYKRSVGKNAGLAELMVFYCECAAGFCNDVGFQDEGYFNALVRMYEQALKATTTLSSVERKNLLARLDALRRMSHDFGYGVGDDMDDLLARYHDG